MSPVHAGSHVDIDGTFGEGGGQILRTSLALSCVTGRPLRMTNIRGKRSRPGLRRQHLTCVRAARDICGAIVAGDKLGSQEVRFEPGPVQPGPYRLDIESAGSTTLVAQTLLPALLLAEGRSEVTITGGTHNPWAPPLDFLREVFLPAIARMGFCARATIRRHGFYPVGGGEITLSIEPLDRTAAAKLDWCDPVADVEWTGRIYDAQLPPQVIEAERSLLRKAIPAVGRIEHRRVTDSPGPGNCVMLVGAWPGAETRPQSGASRMILTAFGEKRKRARVVMEELKADFEAFVAAGAPVDVHLADQLLIYLALSGGGRFRAGEVSLHARTNMAVVEKFLPVRFAMEPTDAGHLVRCEVR